MGKRIVFINPPVQAVSAWQMYNYAEPYPYGLLKLGTMLKRQGHEVRLVDMMTYDHLEKSNMADWPTNAVEYSTKHAGNASVTDVVKPAYLLGRDMDWLRARLAQMETPDEVWVTACLTFDWETAHDAIAVVKELWPDTHVKFGGNYPTLLPEHAATSQADEIIEGVVEEAEWEFGDLSLYEETPPLGLFNLGTGCSNRCTFCVNHRYRPTLRHHSRKLLYYILKAHKDYGITHFSNWDPNVLLFENELTEFLDMVIASGAKLSFAFNMGIQPDRLNADMTRRMLKAGVSQLTIPFESSDPDIMRRYRKPYKFGAPLATMRMIREEGFAVGRFHATAVFGYDDEKIRYLFRTYLSMVMFGAQPVFFPITPTPTSAEFTRVLPVLGNKPHDELNGYLFPLIGSTEKVALYDHIISMCNQHYLERAIPFARQLPEDLEQAFFEELETVESELRKDGIEPVIQAPRRSS
jgi:hypothetical protein